MRCTFCTRQAVYEFDDTDIRMCESCGKAFRMGFDKGRIYECADRRKRGR